MCIRDRLGDGLRDAVLVVSRRRAREDDLVDLPLELGEGERTVVLRARQAEPVVDELLLARLVAVVHRPQLRHGDVALVDDREEVVREVVEQALRRLARRAAGERTRVVLDAVAVAELPHHLDVVLGALAEALRLQVLLRALEVRKPLLQFRLDAPVGGLHLVLRHHELLGGRDDGGGHRDAHAEVGHRERVDGVDLVAEEVDADPLRRVGGEDVHRVAAYAEVAGRVVKVVARVLRGDEACDEVAAPARVPDGELHGEVAVFGRFAEAVDAAHGGDDDHVAPGDERVRRGEAVALDLLVDGGVLLDVGVRLRDVRLGLVVVVVADEVLDGVLGEEALQFGEELRGERLVVGEDERGAVPALDEVRHRERLAAAGDALEDEAVLAAREPAHERVDGLGLVARRPEVRDELEERHVHRVNPSCRRAGARRTGGAGRRAGRGRRSRAPRRPARSTSSRRGCGRGPRPAGPRRRSPPSSRGCRAT